MKKKRLVVYVEEDLLLKVKLLALQRGVSVSKLVEDVLQELTKDISLQALRSDKDGGMR